MKKLIALVLVGSMAVMLAGCTDNREICGKTYEPYGLFTLDKANPKVRYEASVGDIVWSVILIETVFVPIYLLGFRVMQPTSAQDAGHEPGVVGAGNFGVDCPK